MWRLRLFYNITSKIYSRLQINKTEREIPFRSLSPHHTSLKNVVVHLAAFRLQMSGLFSDVLYLIVFAVQVITGS